MPEPSVVVTAARPRLTLLVILERIPVVTPVIVLVSAAVRAPVAVGPFHAATVELLLVVRVPLTLLATISVHLAVQQRPIAIPIGHAVPVSPQRHPKQLRDGV